MDGCGLGVGRDPCANKGMIYHHLHNLTFVHTKGQIFRSAVWGQDFGCRLRASHSRRFPGA